MGSTGPRTALERLAARAAAAEARSGPLVEPSADDRVLGHQEAVDAVLLAFPGTVVLEDWQQVGPSSWVDRRTGLRQDDTPRGATPLTAG